MVKLFHLLCKHVFEVSLTNNVDPDRTAPVVMLQQKLLPGGLYLCVYGYMGD